MSRTAQSSLALLAVALGGCIPDVAPPPASAGAPAVAALRQRALPGASRVSGRLARGVNVGNRLDAPSEGEWGVTLDEAPPSRPSPRPASTTSASPSASTPTPPRLRPTPSTRPSSAASTGLSIRWRARQLWAATGRLPLHYMELMSEPRGPRRSLRGPVEADRRALPEPASAGLLRAPQRAQRQAHRRQVECPPGARAPRGARGRPRPQGHRRQLLQGRRQGSSPPLLPCPPAPQPWSAASTCTSPSSSPTRAPRGCRPSSAPWASCSRGRPRRPSRRTAPPGASSGWPPGSTATTRSTPPTTPAGRPPSPRSSSTCGSSPSAPTCPCTSASSAPSTRPTPPHASPGPAPCAPRRRSAVSPGPTGTTGKTSSSTIPRQGPHLERRPHGGAPPVGAHLVMVGSLMSKQDAFDDTHLMTLYQN